MDTSSDHLYAGNRQQQAAGLCQGTHLGMTLETVVSLSLLGSGKLLAAACVDTSSDHLYAGNRQQQAAGLCQGTHLGMTLETVVSLSLLGE